MQNKARTFALLTAVILIWGIIIYRIAATVQGDEPEPVPIAHSDPGHVPADDYASVKDTGNLNMNYRDPFESIRPKDTVPFVVINSKRRERVNVPPQKLPVNWGLITYTGYMSSRSSKRIIAFVSVDGKSLMLREGEQTDQVKLIKNMKDSVKIKFMGQSRVILLN